LKFQRMLLCIDIGNTWTKFGLFLEDKITFRENIPTGISPENIFKKIKPSAICISSVVPKENQKFIEISRNFGIKPLFVSIGDIKTTIKNKNKIGQDRIANVLAGLYFYRPPMIIVDLGTATVFDVVDKNGYYIGGCILPGIETSASFLWKKAALLEPIEIKKPDFLIGNDTEQALRSGIFYGAIAQIEGIAKMIKKEIGKADVILTGNISSLFTDHFKVDEDLTLKGIKVYYEKTRQLNLS